MAGDHLDLGSMVDGRAQSVVVRKYFSKLGSKTLLLICSGNHDLDAKNESGERTAKWLGGPQGALSPPMASRSCSRRRYSPCARGGTDRS